MDHLDGYAMATPMLTETSLREINGLVARLGRIKNVDAQAAIRARLLELGYRA